VSAPSLRAELAAIAAQLGTLTRTPGPLDYTRLGDLLKRLALAYGRCGGAQ
jgi:hypothetical protein